MLRRFGNGADGTVRNKKGKIGIGKLIPATSVVLTSRKKIRRKRRDPGGEKRARKNQEKWPAIWGSQEGSSYRRNAVCQKKENQIACEYLEGGDGGDLRGRKESGQGKRALTQNLGWREKKVKKFWRSGRSVHSCLLLWRGEKRRIERSSPRVSKCSEGGTGDS